MGNILFYDVETTGLPEWKIPSGDPKQPHVVQLGAVLCDSKTEEIIKELDVIVKPKDWAIPQEMTDIHGVSHQQALEEGIPEEDAVFQLLEMWSGGIVGSLDDLIFSLRAAHNKTFDQRIIRIALKRYFSEEVQERWAWKDDFFCTMWGTRTICNIPNVGKKGIKPPTLEEAYKFFTGEDMVGAHSALPDAKACMEIYFAMRKPNPDVDLGEKPAFGGG